MTWQITDHVDEFLAAAGPFLRARPVQNTLLLTIADAVGHAGPTVFGDAQPWFGWWQTPDGSVGAAALQTPPRPLLLSAAPPAAMTSLAKMLAAAGRTLSGINAELTAAEAFAAAWQDQTGARGRPGDRIRLYRLAELVPPVPPVPGAARTADTTDLDLVHDWWQAFHRDIGEHAEHARDRVTEKVAYGGIRLWEVDDQPVAMAGLTPALAGMVRVMAVYTPDQFRRRGYAAAVTAAVSRAALDAGASDVVLYADVANPTSNGVYLRLGYQPVEERIALSFAA